jgi:protein-tyrosine phosphatase
MGFEKIYATPHQKAGSFMPSREAIDGSLGTVREALRDKGLAVELSVGAENFWDDVFHERLATKALPTYAGTQAFLVEIHPHLAPPRMEDALFQMRLGGLHPVLAHPERYEPLWPRGGALDRYEAVGRSAALVVDLGALDGAHGRTEKQVARRLVEEGLAHAAASDTHTTSDARSAAAGMAWIKKRLGPPAVERLLSENPRRILAGQMI